MVWFWFLPATDPVITHSEDGAKELLCLFALQCDFSSHQQSMPNLPSPFAVFHSQWFLGWWTGGKEEGIGEVQTRLKVRGFGFSFLFRGKLGRISLSRIWNFAWWKYDIERFEVTPCNDYLLWVGVVLKRIVGLNSEPTVPFITWCYRKPFYKEFHLFSFSFEVS